MTRLLAVLLLAGCAAQPVEPTMGDLMDHYQECLARIPSGQDEWLWNSFCNVVTNGNLPLPPKPPPYRPAPDRC